MTPTVTLVLSKLKVGGISLDSPHESTILKITRSKAKLMKHPGLTVAHAIITNAERSRHTLAPKK